MTDEETPYSHLEEVPEDRRHWSCYRGLPKTEADWLEKCENWTRELHKIYPSVFDADGKPLPRNKRDRDEPERAADALAACVKEEVEKLLAVPTDVRILAAAPFRPHVKRRPRSSEFDARHPRLLPSKHQVFIDNAGQRTFTTVARDMGMTAQAASHRRAELSLLFLLEQRPCDWSVINAHVKNPPEDEWAICSAVFKPLWDAHESNLVRAEEDRLYREGAEFSLLTTRGKLLVEFWQKLTALKRNGGHEVRDYRQVFISLGQIVDFIREEFRHR